MNFVMLTLMCSIILNKKGGDFVAYDYGKLKGRIVEKYGNQHSFAFAMGWSERTCSLKLTNKVFWKQPEISLAARLLNINENEIKEFFFTSIVQ